MDINYGINVLENCAELNFQNMLQIYQADFVQMTNMTKP
jgi:hypothetical protein